MSFFDDILSGVGNLLGFGDSGNGIGGNILSAVLSGLALNKMQDSTDPGNSSETPDPEQEKELDMGVRLQGQADPHNKIPIVYGNAYTQGLVIDQYMNSTRDTMYYCLVLSEKTGNLNLGAGSASTFTFEDIYWNNARIDFKADGVTADYTVDRNGKVDRSVDGLVKVYCFNNGSTNQVMTAQGGSASLQNAYDIMPHWTSSWTLDELVFIIVEVDYSADHGVTGIGNITVHLDNDMYKAGDVMYDYMTNTRYGAGIPAAEINIL